MPGLDELGVDWLEEPFPAHDYASYGLAKSFGRVPLAAGENHFTRFEFNRLIEERSITILQPDLSKTGGITETLRIAAMASAYKLPINPHTSMTGLNMAASIHFLAAIENGGYFEGDVSKKNLFRDKLVARRTKSAATVASALGEARDRRGSGRGFPRCASGDRRTELRLIDPGREIRLGSRRHARRTACGGETPWGLSTSRIALQLSSPGAKNGSVRKRSSIAAPLGRRLISDAR